MVGRIEVALTAVKDHVSVAVIGFGTVGQGTVRVLQDNAAEIERRLGFELRLRAIASRHISARDTSWVDHSIKRTSNIDEILSDPEIDIVVELIGGIEPARTIVLQALRRRKCVVTANKLLLANCGMELMEAALANRMALGIEAAVAGSIPILRAIREGLVGERIRAIYGILNGTTNYILSQMESTGRQFSEVLKEAQERGYAEADPTFDVQGYDARDKLVILTMMCFGVRLDWRQVHVSGVSRISSIDFQYANRLGYTIKLLGSAQRLQSGKLAVSVEPTLVRRSSMLAKVDGPFNAIMVRGEHGGDWMFYGQGAGGSPTGIAVVSDIVAIARDLVHEAVCRAPAFSYQEFKDATLAEPKDCDFPYYLRFVVHDQPGIIASLAQILASHRININSVIQEPFQDKSRLPFVITLEHVSEDRVRAALDRMRGLPFLHEEPLALRIDDML